MANSLDLQNKVDKEETAETPKRRVPKREIIVGTLALVATLALSVVLLIYKKELVNLSFFAGYGLLGMLIVAFLGGSFLSFAAIPVPYWILVFTMPSLLDAKFGLAAPLFVGLVSALGTTAGHMPTFFIGYGGRSLSQRVTNQFGSRIYARVIAWAQKHGSWAVFLMSAIFNPVHLPMTVAIGALRYPPLKFFFYSFLGNAVKGLFLAFAGYFGLNSLLKLLGM